VARAVAWIANGARVLSVMTAVDGEIRHRYRLRGGPDDGREFATLLDVVQYAAALGLDVTAAV
jgi:hypothetical protein